MTIILHIDTPLYEISANQYDFFHSNGYIIIDSIFSTEECDRIYQLFSEHADPDYSAIINLDREEEELHNIMKMRKVVSVVEGLMKSEASGLMTQMLFKEAGTKYATQSWTVHQDNAYHQNPNGATLTINIACKAADKENGTLYVFPGSHKEGILPFEERKSYREDKDDQPGNTLKLPKHYLDKKTDVIMKKGDMLVLHGNCAHGSYGNISLKRSRPLYSITYIKKGESFVVGENANRKEFLLH